MKKKTTNVNKYKIALNIERVFFYTYYMYNMHYEGLRDL